MKNTPTDKERLDWLEANLYTLWASGLRIPVDTFTPPVEMSAKNGRFEGDSLREVIDKAMK